jgi:hypothetical protein
VGLFEQPANSVSARSLSASEFLVAIAIASVAANVCASVATVYGAKSEHFLPVAKPTNKFTILLL